MDALIRAAAHALARGDVLTALKHVALRDDPSALALRGIVMAQLGELDRAKSLLDRAAQAFERQQDALAHARCVVALAEIALVSRDLNWPVHALDAACETLARKGDLTNAAHARNLAARRWLLIGRMDEADNRLSSISPAALPPASRAAYALTVAGIAVRRLQIKKAHAAFIQATEWARQADNPVLSAEIEIAARVLQAPAARAITAGQAREVLLADVQALRASDALVIDACRNVLHRRNTRVELGKRPVLFALIRCLGEAAPHDVPRDLLLLRAFRARHTDDSHRARLRVEIGRLRTVIRPFGQVNATERGFVLVPHAAERVTVLAPLTDERNAAILALLADGEAWSSSALAIALDSSPRTVQRALEQLAAAGKAQYFGAGRARRWTVASVPGFPTTLLLPDVVPDD